MKAFILSLVTRRPLTVPVTGFSKGGELEHGSLFWDVVSAFWQPHSTIQQTVAWLYGAVSGGLPVKVCACVCVSSVQKVVISLNVRPCCEFNDSLASSQCS